MFASFRVSCVMVCLVQPAVCCRAVVVVLVFLVMDAIYFRLKPPLSEVYLL